MLRPHSRMHRYRYARVALRTPPRDGRSIQVVSLSSTTHTKMRYVGTDLLEVPYSKALVARYSFSALGGEEADKSTPGVFLARRHTAQHYRRLYSRRYLTCSTMLRTQTLHKRQCPAETYNPAQIPKKACQDAHEASAAHGVAFCSFTLL